MVKWDIRQRLRLAMNWVDTARNPVCTFSFCSHFSYKLYLSKGCFLFPRVFARFSGKVGLVTDTGAGSDGGCKSKKCCHCTTMQWFWVKRVTVEVEALDRSANRRSLLKGHYSPLLWKYFLHRGFCVLQMQKWLLLWFALVWQSVC